MYTCIYMFICLCHLHMYASMRCIRSYGSYVIPGGLVHKGTGAQAHRKKAV